MSGDGTGPSVDFHLLGGVAADWAGVPVPLGHARQRSVLAALLVDANRAVSVDELTFRVWAHYAPRRYRSALYTYVSRLRQLVSGAGARIVRTSGGYELAVDPDRVDLHRFRRLVTRALDADDAAAMSILERALALWPAHPPAAYGSPWLESMRAAWEAERFAAMLARNDVSLRLGHQSHLLSELSASAGRHPLDERLTRQLMLALHRAGRTGEALAAYEVIRARLRQERGGEPGAGLETLYRQLTRGEAPAAAPAPPPPWPGALPPVTDLARPARLPRDLAAFAGREMELAQLDALLAAVRRHRGTGLVIPVVGPAGIGKSALAVRWAHRVAHRFPDGQLHVDLRADGPEHRPAPGQAVGGVLAALGVAFDRIPGPVAARAALLRALLADRRMLLLLDHARDAAELQPVLSAAPGCLVVITARRELTGLLGAECAQPLALALPSLADARHIFARRVGAARARAEPAATDEIILACSRLPLALAVVGAGTAHQPGLPLRALAGRLRQGGTTFDAITPGDAGVDVRAAFGWSYRALCAPAARLFRLLGLHLGPEVSSAAAASLAGAAPADVVPLLTELTHASLLSRRGRDRWAMHDLLRAYAGGVASVVDGPAKRAAAVHRLLDHYLHTAGAASAALDPDREPVRLPPPRPGTAVGGFPDRAAALAWLAGARPTLGTAAERAAELGLDAHPWHAVRAGVPVAEPAHA
jgi:DNA-binding SARP family transcriptional activator